MKKLTITPLTPEKFLLNGDLTFATIDKRIVNSINFSVLPDAISIDLQQVNTTDSAGLALIIEWIKLAKAKQIHLLFENIPDQLLALAKLGGLEQVVNITEHLGSPAIDSEKH